MNRIQESLTRKFGPLPAWGWLAILAVGVIYYRRKFGAISSGTGTGSVAPSGPEPGTNEQVLQPGESIYDPTTGSLTTAPGGGGDSSTAGDLAAAMDALANAIGQGMPPTQVNVTLPDQTGNPGTGGGRGGGNGGGGHGGKHNQKARQKRQEKRSENAAKRAENAAKKAEARSKAAQRNHAGGRTKGRTGGKRPGERGMKETGRPSGSHNGVGTGRAKNGTASKGPTRTRQPSRTPATTQVIRQRPVSTHPAVPAPNRRPEAAPVHRPSAPPPRAHRGNRGK